MLNMMPLSRHTLSLQTRLHRQFILGTVIPPTLPNPPTAPTPIEANTFVHILDSPTHSPSPFQFPPQEVITRTLEEPPKRNVATQPQGLLPCPEPAPPTLGKAYNSWYKC